MKLSYSLIKPIYIVIGISTIILFVSSSLKHILFQSTSWDLAIFDQAIYLISRGKSPLSSFLNIHILGDHAALIFYPLSLFYKLYSSVYWLFFIQAFSLSLGALPIWHLAKYQGLKNSQRIVMALAYILYPLIFNINLFDFHPDVIAIPAILWAILAAYTNHLWGFILALIIIFSCKGVLSLTVTAMGIWLLLCEKKRLYGFIALVLGVTWFIISTQLIIPFFSDNSANIGRHISRFSYLGNSFTEIIQNFIVKPWLLWQGLFNLPNLEYLLLLLLPLIWGLSFRHLSPLVGAIPVLAMNLLSQDTLQKDLLHQYSLPIIPFLMIISITTVATEKAWFRQEKYIIIWSLIGFLALAKVGYFTSRYLDSLDTWKATQEAIHQISSKGNVLTSTYIGPHLSQRPTIKLAEDGAESFDLKQFDYILLNQRHPGRASSPELIEKLREKARQITDFQLVYEKDDIYLFKQ